MSWLRAAHITCQQNASLISSIRHYGSLGVITFLSEVSLAIQRNLPEALEWAGQRSSKRVFQQPPQYAVHWKSNRMNLNIFTNNSGDLDDVRWQIRFQKWWKWESDVILIKCLNCTLSVQSFQPWRGLKIGETRTWASTLSSVVCTFW